jgi:ribose transport system substrate-binding protein
MSFVKMPARVAIAFGALALAIALPAGGLAHTAASKPSIVWLELGSGNPYWDAQHQAAAAYANQAGFSFKAVSGQSNPSTQATILKQLADQHVNVVMLNPVDAKALVPAVKYAVSKGTKVLSVYSVTPGATASAVFDEIRSGRIDAINAVNLLKQRYGKAQGTIAVLEGLLGQPASDLRAKGFVDYMKTQPGIKIVAQQPTDWTAAKASAAMQDWLVKYPDLSMVYGLSDTITVPALNVAQRQNRVCTTKSNWTKSSNCIVFVSVDGSFINDVASGELYSTELYSPYWTGNAFAKLAWQLAQGKKLPKVDTVKSLLVTPENAACVAKMANDMQSKLNTFPFVGTLQQIASQKYHCKVLDANE